MKYDCSDQMYEIHLCFPTLLWPTRDFGIPYRKSEKSIFSYIKFNFIHSIYIFFVIFPHPNDNFPIKILLVELDSLCAESEI